MMTFYDTGVGVGVDWVQRLDSGHAELLIQQ